MKFMTIIHRLFLVFGLLGIIVGPVGLSTADTATASSYQAMTTAIDMQDDMPCCTGGNPEKPDCRSAACPLVLLCNTGLFAGTTDEQILSVNLVWTGHRFVTSPQPVLASMLPDPPARPPRI